MKSILAMAFLAGGIFLAGGSAARANVFAAHLTKTANGDGTITFHYRLNEPADAGVIIHVKGPTPAVDVVRTITVPSQPKGPNTVSWDGKNNSGASLAPGSYTWEVAPSATGYSDYTQTSDDANTANKFSLPYGLAVDNDVSSPRFGTIYIGNSNSGTAGTRTTPNGIYILGNDQSDITNQGDTPYTGNVAWQPSFSPFGIHLDNDGHLFLSDNSKLNSGIWIMDVANPSADFSELFSTTLVRNGNGLVTGLHGKVPTLWITGSGVNRKLFTIDVDLPYPSNANQANGTGNILEYDIGTASINWSTAPTILYKDADNNNLEVKNSYCIAKDDGGWWIGQQINVDAADVPGLIHYNPTTNTVDYNSFTNSPGVLGSMGAATLAINPSQTKLAESSLGTVKIFDISSFASTGNVTLIGTISTGKSSNAILATYFDAAGNLYYSYSFSSTLKLMRVISPSGANSFTTPAPADQIIPTSELPVKLSRFALE